MITLYSQEFHCRRHLNGLDTGTPKVRAVLPQVPLDGLELLVLLLRHVFTVNDQSGLFWRCVCEERGVM